MNVYRKWARFNPLSEGHSSFVFGVLFLLILVYVVVVSIKSDIYTTAMFIDSMENNFPILENNYVGFLFEEFANPVSNYAENAAVLLFGLGLVLHFLYASEEDTELPGLDDGIMAILGNKKSLYLVLIVGRGVFDVYTDVVAVTPAGQGVGEWIENIIYAVFMYEIISEFMFIICLEIVIDKLLYPAVQKVRGNKDGDGKSNNKGSGGSSKKRGPQTPPNPAPSKGSNPPKGRGRPDIGGGAPVPGGRPPIGGGEGPMPKVPPPSGRGGGAVLGGR